MAKAIRFHHPGGPEVLRYEDVEVGEPGPGQVRLRHVAVGLNYADIYFRSGTYPVPLPSGLEFSTCTAGSSSGPNAAVCCPTGRPLMPGFPSRTRMN